MIKFNVEGPDGTTCQIKVKYSDFGMKLEPKEHPSPNKNKEKYEHLNKH